MKHITYVSPLVQSNLSRNRILRFQPEIRVDTEGGHIGRHLKKILEALNENNLLIQIVLKA